MPPALPERPPLVPRLPLDRVRLVFRRRRLGWWPAIVLLAALTAASLAGLSAEARATVARYGSTRPVLVAAVDLPAGVPVPPDAVRTEDRPVGLVPDDALDTLPSGATTRAPVAAGEVVLGRRLDPSGASPLAAALPDGSRGVAVPRTDTVPELQPGDRVDVLVAHPGLEPGVSPARTAATGAVVAHVGELAVLVAVRPHEVGEVASAAGAGLAMVVLVPAGG
jgi:Flp pilus assembly protein CpaB